MKAIKSKITKCLGEIEMCKKKLDEKIQKEDGQVCESEGDVHIMNKDDSMMDSVSCVGFENSDLDGIDDIDVLKRMIIELRKVKIEQDEEIDDWEEYVGELEEEIRCLDIRVKGLIKTLQKASQKPWKPIRLPRWDK